MKNKNKTSKVKEIVSKLHNLPEEDRIILGLYLYEKLSSDQIKKVLNKEICKHNDSSTVLQPTV